MGVSASFGVPCDAVSLGFHRGTQSAPNKRDVAMFSNGALYVSLRSKSRGSMDHLGATHLLLPEGGEILKVARIGSGEIPKVARYGSGEIPKVAKYYGSGEILKV